MTAIALRHPSLTLSYVGNRRGPRATSLITRARVQFSARRFRQLARNLFAKPGQQPLF